jgi:spermidine/putrescine transport system substrate-binding protein
MKKILMLAVFILTISLLVGCESGPTLRLYNWGEYIDDELVYEFEDQTGIKVKQIAFDSNEVALTQIKSGNQYDLVIPSEYAIEQLIEEDLIEMIDWTKITTFDRDTDLAEGLNDILTELSEGAQGYDLLDYAIPYFWGNVGILYDTTTVEQTDLTGWDVLTNSDYEIAFYNSSRDSFMLALKATGANSINTPTDAEFETAASWLGDALTSETYVITDEIFDAMLDPARYDLAVSYSGDANYLMSENENLDFFVPEEGTNIWVDAFITPKGANMDYAYQFMNFMLSYDSALRNTEFVGYSTPRKDVFEEVLDVDGSFEDYATSYDVRQNDNDEVYRYNESLKLEMDTKWQEILADKGYDDNEGLGTGAIAAIVVIGVLVMSTVVTTIIKKRR